MPDFLSHLAEVLGQRGPQLRQVLDQAQEVQVPGLGPWIRDHWAPLPATQPARPACAVDGGLGQVDLANGCGLVVAQALALGSRGQELSSLALELLPPAAGQATAARLADLLLKREELRLAARLIAEGHLARGDLLLLDGALHGLLPQLYPLRLDEELPLPDYPQAVLEAYLQLLTLAREAGVDLLAVAKSSRQTVHLQVWGEAQGAGARPALPGGWSDASLLQRHTQDAPGFSRPVLLGSHGFAGGSLDILARADVAASAAIASGYVRLAPWEELLRVDLPAHQAGDPRCLADVEAELLPGGADALAPFVAQLVADWGGEQVYNVLLYATDQAVRLSRRTLVGTYLPLVADQLGQALQPDRSSRRFL